MENKQYYFVSGNTAKGLVHLLPSNLNDIDRTIVLHSPSQKVKTYIINYIIERLAAHHFLEVIYSPFGKTYLDGVIIREKGIAIISDTSVPEGLKNVRNIFLVSDEYSFADEKSQERAYRNKAYEHFATALSIHDDLEKIYIREMDFAKADQMAEQFIHQLLDKAPQHEANDKPHIYRRMFGTTTAEGAINIVPELIATLQRRVYLKGRAGTGKSFFMKKVAKACEEKGFDLELYHCSFDPDSIDMVRVPDLGFCIFDSTTPHEFFPERNDDQIIDLYEGAVNPGVDERFADEIKEVTDNYRVYIQKGKKCLQTAQKWQEKIDNHDQFIREIDVEKIVAEILT